jgi:glycosyltransferase involved in cell wall biosynthesis
MTTPSHLLMTADAVGGVWTHALDLAAALAEAGTRTTLVTLGPPPGPVQRAEAVAVPGLSLVETGLALDWLAENEAEIRSAGRVVADLAAEQRVDLVQLNSPALAAATRFPAPVLGVCHSCVATWWEAVRGGGMPADFAWRATLLARGYAACDALVAPSFAFAGATARAYRLPRPPEVVWNGRVTLPATGAMAPFAFTAGRLWDDGKDVATLDRTAGRLGVPFHAAGPVEGPNGARMALRDLRHLLLLGNLSAAELRGWLSRGPIFVSAARYEPFGLAVLEAAQAGCALVLSDIPTFRELWDGAARFVVPGDDEGFAKAVEDLSRNQEQRSLLRVAAMRRAQRYSAAAMARGMAAIHGRLRTGRAQPGGRSAA